MDGLCTNCLKIILSHDTVVALTAEIDRLKKELAEKALYSYKVALKKKSKSLSAKCMSQFKKTIQMKKR
jgi:hypothetical protein